MDVPLPGLCCKPLRVGFLLSCLADCKATGGQGGRIPSILRVLSIICLPAKSSNRCRIQSICLSATITSPVLDTPVVPVILTTVPPTRTNMPARRRGGSKAGEETTSSQADKVTMKAPTPAPITPSSSFNDIATILWQKYITETPQRTLLLDSFMAFLVLLALVEFTYCIVFGSYVSPRQPHHTPIVCNRINSLTQNPFSSRFTLSSAPLLPMSDSLSSLPACECRQSKSYPRRTNRRKTRPCLRATFRSQANGM